MPLHKLNMINLLSLIQFIKIIHGEKGGSTSGTLQLTNKDPDLRSLHLNDSDARHNCTKCTVWKGDVCKIYESCILCNTTCPNDKMVCRDGICKREHYHSFTPKRDPLGKIIALILLVIFLVSVLTLCIRICSSTCGGSGRQCCVIHCAVSFSCCCDWKAGRLRVLPSGVTNTESAAARHNRSTRNRPRNALNPPPPPAYIELYPDGAPPPPMQQDPPSLFVSNYVVNDEEGGREERLVNNEVNQSQSSLNFNMTSVQIEAENDNNNNEEMENDVEGHSWFSSIFRGNEGRRSNLTSNNNSPRIASLAITPRERSTSSLDQQLEPIVNSNDDDTSILVREQGSTIPTISHLEPLNYRENERGGAIWTSRQSIYLHQTDNRRSSTSWSPIQHRRLSITSDEEFSQTNSPPPSLMCSNTNQECRRNRSTNHQRMRRDSLNNPRPITS